MVHKQSVEHLFFEPPFGLSSPHVQTVLGCFFPSGSPPPSEPLIIPLADGDSLCCEVSTPPSWQPSQKTIVMVHGLGGSHNSCYMVRISRKLYQAGYRVVRTNMRGCGSGEKLAHRPYHGGVSDDVLTILQALKKQYPSSPIILMGFSLGGNIALKLLGEMEGAAIPLIHSTIAVCPPVDLAQTAALLSRPINRMYHQYYIRNLEQQTRRWINGDPFTSLYDFDSKVTTKQWGFKGAFDYYQQCSSRFLLDKIQNPCQILFAADDPFIDYNSGLSKPLPSNVKVWLSPYGGHMGFLGWTGREHYYFWLDNLLLTWLKT